MNHEPLTKRQRCPCHQWSRPRSQSRCQLPECWATTWFRQFDGRLFRLRIWPAPVRSFESRVTPLPRLIFPGVKRRVVHLRHRILSVVAVLVPVRLLRVRLSRRIRSGLLRLRRLPRRRVLRSEWLRTVRSEQRLDRCGGSGTTRARRLLSQSN